MIFPSGAQIRGLRTKVSQRGPWDGAAVGSVAKQTTDSKNNAYRPTLIRPTERSAVTARIG